MQLTSFTDYALRLLMLAQAAGDRLITIEEAAMRYRISKPHLMKVANELTRAGFLKAVRGRGGGLRLGKAPQDIRLGDVVRATEPGFALVECFATGNQCTATAICRLPRVLNEALAAFLSTLDKYTLADIALSRVPGESAGRDPATGRSSVTEENALVPVGASITEGAIRLEAEGDGLSGLLAFLGETEDSASEPEGGTAASDR